jgi:ParB family chromosome partitioning protein
MGEKGNGAGESASLRGRTIPAFSVDPRELTLVTDPKHPLYDERVHAPLDEAMIASIMAVGVIEPVVVRKNGPLLEVAVGRQRVKNATEANRRLKAEGRYLIKVPIVIRTGEPKDIIVAAVIENEIRRPDVILIKSAKARRMQHFGHTIADIAVAFGVVPETIENWLKLDELHPTIKRLVAKGKLNYTVAMRLAKLQREKQLLALEELLKAGATNANAVRVVVGGRLEKVRPPSKQVLRRVADAMLKAKEFLRDDASSDSYAFVSWVLGCVSSDELLKGVLSSKPIADAVRVGLGRIERRTP